MNLHYPVSRSVLELVAGKLIDLCQQHRIIPLEKAMELRAKRITNPDDCISACLSALREIKSRKI